MNIIDIAIAKQLAGGGGGSGTDNYNDLSNLPKINDTTLSGNKSSSALGLQSEINSESKLASDLVDDTNQDNKFVTSAEKTTWNAKQNAIDADHKLSSSLVSFSEAEAAAIASGIDSSKVGQISTNQTNILLVKDATEELVDKGAKNIIDIQTPEESLLTSYTSTANGGVALTIKNAAWTSYRVRFSTIINTAYVCKILVDSAPTTNVNVFIQNSSGENYTGGDINSNTTEFIREFTATETALGRLSINLNNEGTPLTNAITVRVMICTKAEYDISPAYEPYALPNYDLTYREQQDRNALVEVVDKGAKNILPPTDLIPEGDGLSNNPNLTCTNNGDGTYTLNGSTVENGTIIIHYSMTSDLYGGYMLSGCPNINADSEKCRLSIYTYAAASGVCQDSGQGKEIPTSFDPSFLAIYVFAGNTFNNVKFYPMICTKEEFKISPSYQPYTLPNTDLTRMMTPFFTVPINHNMIYRGQNLGDTLTADQDTALSSGNFTDLYLGDYWTKQITIPAFYEVTAAEPADWSTNYTSYYTKSGDTYTPVTGDTAPTWAANTYYERLVPSQTVTLKAVIADFDTFYAGYASDYAVINTHHAAVIVTGFNNVVWNKTNSTAGGYVASLIHKWLVGSALPQIETWFGSAKVLSHQKLLTNAITGDAASGWAWSSQKIALLSENQMYGSKVWGGSKATNGGYEPGEAFKHLNVFNHIDANLLFGNKNIWLRDIASAVWAAFLDNRGNAGYSDASNAWIAPAALILLS